MIKVMVVIYGLVMFVPTVKTVDGVQRTELTAIFVKGEEVGGSHMPAFRWVTGDSDVQEPPWTPAPGNDFEALIKSPFSGNVGLTAKNHFPELSFLAPNRPIRRGCLQANGHCRDLETDSDLTHGVALFQGEWRTREATYCCGFARPLGDHDRAVVRFPHASGSDSHYNDSLEAATALILEIDVPASKWNDFEAVYGGMNQKQTPLKKAACLKWIGSRWMSPDVDGCAILLMGNPSTHAHQCHRSDCRFDKHFSAFYLLTTRPGNAAGRLLPYVVNDAQCPEPHVMEDEECRNQLNSWLSSPLDVLNMPSVRCPPAFAQLEPEAVAESE